MGYYILPGKKNANWLQITPPQSQTMYDDDAAQFLKSACQKTSFQLPVNFNGYDVFYYRDTNNTVEVYSAQGRTVLDGEQRQDFLAMLPSISSRFITSGEYHINEIYLLGCHISPAYDPYWLMVTIFVTNYYITVYNDDAQQFLRQYTGVAQ